MATASSLQGQIDPLLLPFIRCTDERRAMAHLETIIRQHAEPTISEAVRSKVETSADDAIDLHNETVELLLQRLSAIRHNSAYPIANFLSYTRITARRLCFQRFQTARVERHFSSLETDAITISSGQGIEPDACSLLEQRSLLQSLWDEIRVLPRTQRLALLCNCRDQNGLNALPLLAFCSITTHRDLAGALGIAERDLEKFCEQLPMPDCQIGKVLGLTTREVNHERENARRRLKRRVRAWIIQE